MLIQPILSRPGTLGCYSPEFTQCRPLSKNSPLSLRRVLIITIQRPGLCPSLRCSLWLDSSFLGDILFSKLVDVPLPPNPHRRLPGSEKLGTAQWVLGVSLGASLSQTQPRSRHKPGEGPREAHARWMSPRWHGDGFQVRTESLALRSLES